MRILHTSDWHYGRSLKGVDLSAAHEAVAAEIAAIVAERGVDVVVIAGDVYDRAVPHNDAVMLLNRTLDRLCELAPVVLTPGNHDSATRLGFAASRLDERLHICADIGLAHEPVVIADEHGDVAFYALPFLDPDEVRQCARAEGDDVGRTHAEGTGWVMDRVRRDIDQRAMSRSVVIAHAFVVDGAGGAAAEESDSERDLTSGGVDYVPGETFDGVTYVALGHLHGAQSRKPTSSGTVLEYCGSPLRFSFSERHQRKSVTLVDIDAAGAVHTERIPLSQPRGMAQLRGTLDELLLAAEGSGPGAAHVDDWVDITITDVERPERLRDRLVAVYPHTLSFRHEPEGMDLADQNGLGRALNAAATPIEVMTEFVTEVRGTALRDDEREVLLAAAKAAFEGVR